MKIRSRAAAAILAAVALTASMVAGGAASAAPGETPETPIVLTSLADLPAGAVVTGSGVAACATTTTYQLTKPAVVETTHKEFRFKRDVPATSKQQYRWPLDKRTYTPAQSEVSHKVYSYKKVTPAVSEVKEYTFDKFVQRQKAKWNGNTYVGPISAGYSGSYTWRDAGFDPVTNTTGVLPTAPGPQRGEFIHNNGGTWYFTLFYEYRKIGERVVTAAQPEKTEYSGERLTTLGAPWVLMPGYPKTVIDSAAVPASFGPWTADGFTAWSDSNATPADPDGQSGETNPANLRRVGSPMQTQTVQVTAAYTEYYVLNGAPSRDVTKASWVLESQRPAGWVQFEERTVGNGDAVPAVVTYYSYSDGKVCITNTPTPEPPVVTPPPPVDDGKKPIASIDTRCTGTTTFRLTNRRTAEVPFRLHGKGYNRTVTVAPGKSKTVKTKLPNRSRAWVKVEGKKWTATVPKPCPTPPVTPPNTGARTAGR